MIFITGHTYMICLKVLMCICVSKCVTHYTGLADYFLATFGAFLGATPSLEPAAHTDERLNSYLSDPAFSFHASCMGRGP